MSLTEEVFDFVIGADGIRSFLRTETFPNAKIRYDLPTPVFGKGRILLLGDAAHATTPNMGQGAGTAVEDAWILSGLFSSLTDKEDVLPALIRRRLKRVARITKLSYLFGKLAHVRSPGWVHLRNHFVSMIPDAVNKRQMQKFLLKY